MPMFVCAFCAPSGAADGDAGEAEDALQHLFGHEKQLRDRNSLLVSAVEGSRGGVCGCDVMWWRGGELGVCGAGGGSGGGGAPGMFVRLVVGECECMLSTHPASLVCLRCM